MREGVHATGTRDGTSRVIGLVDRRAEQHVDRVPHDAIDRAPISEGDLDQALEIDVEQWNDALRSKSLHECREPAQVGEHEAQVPPLAAQLQERWVLDQQVREPRREVPLKVRSTGLEPHALEDGAPCARGAVGHHPTGEQQRQHVPEGERHAEAGPGEGIHEVGDGLGPGIGAGVREGGEQVHGHPRGHHERRAGPEAQRVHGDEEQGQHERRVLHEHGSWQVRATRGQKPDDGDARDHAHVEQGPDEADRPHPAAASQPHAGPDRKRAVEHVRPEQGTRLGPNQQRERAGDAREQDPHRRDRARGPQLAPAQQLLHVQSAVLPPLVGVGQGARLQRQSPSQIEYAARSEAQPRGSRNRGRRTPGQRSTDQIGPVPES